MHIISDMKEMANWHRRCRNIFLSMIYIKSTAVYNFINDRLADKPAVLKPLS